MAGYVIQASINEKGTVSGGKPGDQNGKEVNISPFVSSKWTRLYVPKDIKRMASACYYAWVLAKENKVGYSQAKRNTLWNELRTHKYKISDIAKCECDCSSFVHACMMSAGFPLEYGKNAFTTSTFDEYHNVKGNMSRIVVAPFQANTVGIVWRKGHMAFVIPENFAGCITAATSVIRGGYGNGSEREQKLRKAGFDPYIVQGIVNAMLKQG